MTTWIILPRGINVGGDTNVSMPKLRALLEEAGFEHVQTHGRSGNIVVSSPVATASGVEKRVRGKGGVEGPMLVLESGCLQRIADGNPFPEGEKDPSRLHVFFPTERPTKPDLKYLESRAVASESFELKDGYFYLWAPDGIGRSKLAQSIEKGLGVTATGRNWRTVCKLLEMVK
jgi:uncharacterized protein (DUF1697 family)